MRDFNDHLRVDSLARLTQTPVAGCVDSQGGTGGRVERAEEGKNDCQERITEHFLHLFDFYDVSHFLSTSSG